MERLHRLQQRWISVAKIQNFQRARNGLHPADLDSGIYIRVARGRGSLIEVRENTERNGVRARPTYSPALLLLHTTCSEGARPLPRICLALRPGAKGDTVCFCSGSAFILRFWLPSDGDSQSSYPISPLCAVTYAGTGRALLFPLKSQSVDHRCGLTTHSPSQDVLHAG